MQGGKNIKTFDTDCGKIGILICYDSEFPELSRLLSSEGMDMQFAQSVVFTPCDFSFPTNGVKAETTPNTEMVLIADVDIDLLRELNEFGSVKNLQDRRTDLFELKKLIQ